MEVSNSAQSLLSLVDRSMEVHSLGLESSQRMCMPTEEPASADVPKRAHFRNCKIQEVMEFWHYDLTRRELGISPMFDFELARSLLPTTSNPYFRYRLHTQGKGFQYAEDSFAAIPEAEVSDCRSKKCAIILIPLFILHGHILNGHILHGHILHGPRLQTERPASEVVTDDVEA